MHGEKNLQNLFVADDFGVKEYLRCLSMSSCPGGNLLVGGVWHDPPV